MDDLQTRIEQALDSKNPRGQLQQLMGTMLENGLERDEIFGVLEGFQARLSREGRSEDADLIQEMIDGFTGWCKV